jgi:hypothetical protein
MIMVSDRYEVMVAFVSGCNAATEGDLLAGFQEWVAEKVTGHPTASVAWAQLIADSQSPEGKSPLFSELSGEPGAAATGKLLDLLDEFLAQGEIREMTTLAQ